MLLSNSFVLHHSIFVLIICISFIQQHLFSILLVKSSPTHQHTSPKYQNTESNIPSHPNILFITTDDLNAQFGPYATEANPLKRDGHTPALDRLVAEGITFMNAYAQIAVCGPSRQSFLSGRYADTIKVYNFESWLPQKSPLINSIPKYLKDKLGYYSYAIGKVFHDNPRTALNDLWKPLEHFSERNPSNKGGENSECGNKWYCAVQDSKKLSDTVTTTYAKLFIKEAAQQPHLYQPFFLAVGLRRPHLTNALPAGYAESIDLRAVGYPSTIEPKINGVPKGGTYRQSLSRYQCESHGRYMMRVNNDTWEPVVDIAEQRATINALTDSGRTSRFAVIKIRQAYLAAIKWVDEKIDMLISTLETHHLLENTLVIFVSDHGFSNGEKGTWCKNSLTERVTKVPVIFRLPKLFETTLGFNVTSTRGSQSLSLVQLVDLFPTIIDLVKGPALPDDSGIPLDGISFFQTLKNPTLFSNAASYSQYPRCGERGQPQINPCTDSPRNNCIRASMKYMGYSIRTPTHRYVEWRPFTEATVGCLKPTWPGKPSSVVVNYPVLQYDVDKTRTDWSVEPFEFELYTNYTITGEIENGETPWEAENLAYNPTEESKKLMKELSRMIEYKFNPAKKKIVCNNRGFLKIDVIKSIVSSNTDDPSQQVEVDEEKEYCECIPPWTGPNCAYLP